MKKLALIVCALVLWCVASRAQDSITIKVPDTTKLSAKMVYEDAKEGIKGLAQALKAPAEHVYHVLIKQQIIYAVTHMAISIFLFILSFIFIRWWYPNYKKTTIKEHSWYKDEWGDHTSIILPAVCATILFTSGVIYTLANVSDTITGLLNPEYGAIRDIFEFVKGKS